MKILLHKAALIEAILSKSDRDITAKATRETQRGSIGRKSELKCQLYYILMMIKQLEQPLEC